MAERPHWLLTSDDREAAGQIIPRGRRVPSHFEGILDGIRVFLAVSGEFSLLHTLWVPPGEGAAAGPQAANRS